jgi:hypothetical protein
MLAYVLREDDPAQVSAIRDGYGYSKHPPSFPNFQNGSNLLPEDVRADAATVGEQTLVDDREMREDLR